MGKCKDCGAAIADDEEYCESCLLLRDLGLNEEVIHENDNIFDEVEGLLPSDDSDLDFTDDSTMSSDLNIDEDFLNFIDSSSSENSEESADEDAIIALDDSYEAEQEIHNEAAQQKEKKVSKSSDVGDILSDALGVLNDPAMDEMEKQIMDMIPEQEKQKEMAESQPVEKKKKIFKKLFENVPGPELGPDEPSTEEELEAQKKAIAEEKKKEKAEKKAEKKAAQEAKKKVKADAKAVKKAEKIRLKEEAAENNTPIDTSKINKVGASILLTIAAFFALFIILGTSTFTYSNNVSSAKEYFSKKQYTKAYQKIAGIEIKSKDEVIYDKIVTVMYVNKQYNSYQNYYNMEMYPEALNSLIKGLERYHKYSEQAAELEVVDDLNYVKSNIDSALKDSFHLSEDDVQYLMNMESQEKYSLEVTKLAKAS